MKASVHGGRKEAPTRGGVCVEQKQSERGWVCTLIRTARQCNGNGNKGGGKITGKSKNVAEKKGKLSLSCCNMLLQWLPNTLSQQKDENVNTAIFTNTVHCNRQKKERFTEACVRVLWCACV